MIEEKKFPKTILEIEIYYKDDSKEFILFDFESSFSEFDLLYENYIVYKLENHLDILDIYDSFLKIDKDNIILFNIIRKKIEINIISTIKMKLYLAKYNFSTMWSKNFSTTTYTTTSVFNNDSLDDIKNIKGIDEVSKKEELLIDEVSKSMKEVWLEKYENPYIDITPIYDIKNIEHISIEPGIVFLPYIMTTSMPIVSSINLNSNKIELNCLFDASVIEYTINNDKISNQVKKWYILDEEICKEEWLKDSKVIEFQREWMSDLRLRKIKNLKK